MVDALVQMLLENANSLVEKEVKLLGGVENDVEKLTRTLLTIQVVLEDAEEKQQTKKDVEMWLRKLKEIAYEVDDILDEYATEASRLEYRRRSMNKIRAYLSIFNPLNVIFRHKIAKKMKEVQAKLDDIADERNRYGFQERNENRRAEVRSSRETSSFLDESKVYGREEDQAKIVQCLVNDAPNFDDVLVYPIVGMGGLGKTTLAQLVYNDKEIKCHFETKIWVSVPQDFDLKKLMNAIAESMDKKLHGDTSLDALQRHLRKLLHGKMYLLVLDDVWNEDPDKWDELKHTLNCGSKGASIIVTTREAKVAKIVGTFEPHDLGTLREDHCWSLFNQQAFGNHRDRSPRIMKIAEEIVKKCKGVPLAAKALGSLMRFKSDDENEWLSVKESELWELKEAKIFPALRLSYLNLPSKAKQCFVYCALFGKNSTFDNKQLIHLWIANGFISPGRKIEVENVGHEICKELALRSIIQDLEMDGSGNILRLKMHDLIHDLAISVMKGECYVSKDGLASNVPKETHHLAISNDIDHVNLEGLEGIKSLRTLLMPRYHIDNVHCDYISKCHSLRSLTGEIRSRKLLASIGNLKHLRHIGLSHCWGIEALPDSICSLWNLQILELIYCFHLRVLPNKLRRLIHLRHFLLDGCVSLTSMPPKLGQMKCLKTLSLFIVDKRRKGCSISELQNLNLAGKLWIKNLERVGGPMDAKEANLGQKENLRILILSWEYIREDDNRRKENDREVLKVLEPHPNLQQLEITGYQGVQLPHWWSSSVLDNIISIRLSGLPWLERLPIEEGREMFPSLSSMYVYNCPKLSFPCLSSVTKLEVGKSDKWLLTSISNLNNLKELKISSLADGVRSFPDEMFTKLNVLKSLEIVCCYELESLPEQGLQGLKSLESLSISHCEKFKSLSPGLQHLSALRSLVIESCDELLDFPDVFQHLISLKAVVLRDSIGQKSKLAALPETLKHASTLERLYICNYQNLTSLPEWLGKLTSLQVLFIGAYKNLSSLPTSIQSLAKLQFLTIYACLELTKRYKQGIGEDWRLISHIPRVVIRDSFI